MINLAYTDDRYCFCCGEKNPLNLSMQFYYENKVLFSEVIIPKEYQGFANVVHGGIIGTVLDEIMVNYHTLKGEKVVTAEYTIRLKAPCPINKKLRLSSRLVKQTSRIYYMSAEAHLEDGSLIAEATATCMRIKDHLDSTKI